MKKFQPIYVIAGKEESLVSEKCREMLDELVEPSQRATGLFNADPKEVEAADILDELRTAPFLSDKRVVVIKALTISYPKTASCSKSISIIPARRASLYWQLIPGRATQD